MLYRKSFFFSQFFLGTITIFRYYLNKQATHIEYFLPNPPLLLVCSRCICLDSLLVDLLFDYIGITCFTDFTLPVNTPFLITLILFSYFYSPITCSLLTSLCQLEYTIECFDLYFIRTYTSWWIILSPHTLLLWFMLSRYFYLNFVRCH